MNVKDQKVNEVIKGIHEAMLRKAGNGYLEKEDIIMENRLFSVLCHDIEQEPIKCADKMNELYGYTLSGNDVIQIFRNRRMSNPVERKELFRWAGEVAGYFEEAAAGKQEAFNEYEKKRKESPLRNRRRHESQERVIVISIYEKYPELDLFDDKRRLYLLGNTMAKYFFYEISDVISEVYGFLSYRGSRRSYAGSRTGRKLSYEQAMQKISRLENTLERTNTMFQDLQDEFEEQLQASKIKELADFFARLNSEKYGCILDELLVMRKGIDELRKSSYELPIEINGLLIMVKKLIQFVRDSHIEPIMHINSVLEVTASDVEYCNYEGTPFTAPEEKKQVKVISPGWIYKDKEFQIARPKIKEEKENEQSRRTQ